jgi:hypothetical protein
VAIGREAIDRHQEKKKSLDITHELGTFFFLSSLLQNQKKKKGKRVARLSVLAGFLCTR